MKETKETYQEWFLEQKTRCISQSEELDDAIEMANSGDAYIMEVKKTEAGTMLINSGDVYNMEGMKVKYADFIVLAISALRYGYFGRVISRPEFIQEHLHIAELSELYEEYVRMCNYYYNGDVPAAKLEEAYSDMKSDGNTLITMIDDLADSLAFFVIKMKREEE